MVSIIERIWLVPLYQAIHSSAVVVAAVLAVTVAIVVDAIVVRRDHGCWARCSADGNPLMWVTAQGEVGVTCWHMTSTRPARDLGFFMFFDQTITTVLSVRFLVDEGLFELTDPPWYQTWI